MATRPFKVRGLENLLPNLLRILVIRIDDTAAVSFGYGNAIPFCVLVQTPKLFRRTDLQRETSRESFWEQSFNFLTYHTI